MDENKKAAQKKKISHFITIAVLVILFLAFIFPFIMVIINAFKTKGDITADPLALVGSHGFILTNFTDAMKKMNFATSFTNSLIITTTSTILTIVLAAMTAFVIVRNNWKVCALLFSAMIASMVIPFQVLMIPLVSLYGGIFGILNSRVTLIFMHVGFSLSMATFMFHGAIHTSIPMARQHLSPPRDWGQPRLLRPRPQEQRNRSPSPPEGKRLVPAGGTISASCVCAAGTAEDFALSLGGRLPGSPGGK